MQNIPLYSKTDYENSTYILVSKIAYLIGVPIKVFEDEHEPPKIEWFEALDQDKQARIIRNLCALRAAIVQNYQAIYTATEYDLKSLYTLPDLIPLGYIEQLEKDGVRVLKSSQSLKKNIVDINLQITNRINNCKKLFPIWIKWEYIRQLFIMPYGTEVKAISSEVKFYSSRKTCYPYWIYINWPYAHYGNILYTDKKFVSLLYQVNADYFNDLSKVSDAGNKTKDGIYYFLERSIRVAVVVDCENADPYKLYATLNNLDHAALLKKIVKIILYNDVHAASAWCVLNKFTDIPIEHFMVDRVKENKSLVDIRLATGTCREFFQNSIDSFIIVSSDSDYWGLISSMPEAHFLLLIENEKCGSDIKRAMVDAGITYCYMDDFFTGNSDAIMIQTVLGEIRHSLDTIINFNINSILNNACRVARVNMSTAERNQFYDKYIKSMRLKISPEGDVSIDLGSF